MNKIESKYLSYGKKNPETSLFKTHINEQNKNKTKTKHSESESPGKNNAVAGFHP